MSEIDGPYARTDSPRGISTLYDSMPDEADSDHSHREEAVKAIGISLLTGFALMLLLVLKPVRPLPADTSSIESLTPHPPHSPPASPSFTPESPETPLDPSNRNSFEDRTSRPSAHHMNSSTPMIPKRLHVSDATRKGGRNSASAIHGLNATLGLVIHGAADGIALGASSLSESGKLGLIVFLAVLVHKGEY